MQFYKASLISLSQYKKYIQEIEIGQEQIILAL